MSDDELDRDGEKDNPTRVTGTGKELLGWLRPGSSTSSSEEQSTDGGDAGGTLDRRTYMLLAGGAAATAVGGTAASNAVSATGTSVSQPDLYGYGGADLGPSGQETTLLSADHATGSVTQTEENAERATAMEIDPGTLVEASLETATVDWFAFEAAADDPITVEYDREDEVGITGLILYDTDGNFKDKLYVGSGSVHTMRTVAETAGEYFLQVIDVTDGAGEYSFAVWLQEEIEDRDDEEDEPPEERHLVLSAVDETAEYSISVDGDAEAGEDANTHEHEFQDTVTDEGDLTVIRGYVSSGGGDDYYIAGEIVDVETTEPLELTVDGEELDVDEFAEDDDPADDDSEDEDSEEEGEQLGYGQGPYGGTEL